MGLSQCDASSFSKYVFLLFCFRGGGVEGLWVLRLVCLLACFIVLVWINFFQIK